MAVPAPALLPAPPARRSDLDVRALVARTRALLVSGVPLTLLLDLGHPDGPPSAALYRHEGGWDAAWLRSA